MQNLEYDYIDGTVWVPFRILLVPEGCAIKLYSSYLASSAEEQLTVLF